MRIKLGTQVGCLMPARKCSADRALLTCLFRGAGDPVIRGWRRGAESQETSVSHLLETQKRPCCWAAPCRQANPGLTGHVVQLLSRVQPFATPWTLAHQAPLSMGFPRQEYWSGLLFSSSRDLPNPGIEPGSPALLADSLLSEPPGKALSSSSCHLITSHVSHPKGTALHSLFCFNFLIPILELRKAMLREINSHTW